MAEPDDRPGSDDPEDPSELMRLIGRTVPRSPHAGTERATGGPAAEEQPGDPDPDAPMQAAADAPPRHVPPHGTAPPGTPLRETGVPGTGAPLPGSGPPDGSVPDTDAPLPGTPPAPACGLRADPAPARHAPAPADHDSPAAPSGGPEEPGEDPDDEPDDEPPGAEEPPFTELTDAIELEKALEALLLVVDTPVDEASLGTTLDQTPARIRQTLDRMSRAYTADNRGIDLRRVGGGWRFYTRDRYAPYVEKLLLDGQRARLTRAALETLAVVAYRQPVTRARVAAVRGVNCDGVLRTLLTRGLVEEAGSEEHTGGTLFRTTEVFLERLGLSSVQELPPLAPLLPDIDAIDDLES